MVDTATRQPRSLYMPAVLSPFYAKGLEFAAVAYTRLRRFAPPNNGVEEGI